MLNRFVIVVVVAVAMLAGSCRPWSKFETSPDAKLSFSVDTMRFDTVFTELGSATRLIKVYNTHDLPIRISKIRLIDNPFAVFNFNIDGVSGNTATDVEIPPRDSLYIFGEVTINPDQPLSSSPFVINAKIEFETNGNVQHVVLEAWGQNANYIPDRWFAGGQAVLVQDAVWDDPRPYVVYGRLYIDSSTLTLPAGCRVHFHGGLAYPTDSTVVNDGALIVLPAGKLKILGTAEKPVVIQSDRIEPEFENVRGQYFGMYIFGGSTGNVVRHAEIKHSIIGLWVDSLAELDMSYSKIHTTSSYGLVGRHAKITATNCLIYDNNSYGLALLFGGNYTLNYLTVASYGNRDAAVRLDNYWCLDSDCNSVLSNPLSLRANNCIFYGSNADELDARRQNVDPAWFDVQIKESVVRVKELLNADRFPDFLTAHCPTCFNGVSTSKVFLNSTEDNYLLDTMSVARGYGLPIPGVNDDLLLKLRNPATPDAGCYEFE
jgi:hypothetical protein